MLIDISSAVSFLQTHDNFTILTHAHPDGDTLGSGFGLCLALRALGKKANVINNEEIPPKFRYLDIEKQEFEEQTVVAVDIADVTLMGNEVRAEYESKVDLSIDHHGSNRLFAKQNYVDSSAAAAAQIIFELIEQLGAEITPQIADCLYTGISTDTGCFRYANVTPATHRIAARLMELGADAAKINVKMFETKTRTYAALERLALDGMEFFYDGKCALITITREMFAKSGSDENECDGIAAISRQIEGVLVGVTMRERRDGTYKASVRTHDPVDASAICGRLGGGGHPNAAGCQLPGTREEATKLLIDTIGEFI
ncbi:MAG: bifunctional oligoribonuclease/PAP phosphatase NrnA [Clostridia bacterium]|nr:bifunctional oligoribonuclease/PAP phosphatase NrnA [Clostridia bacterium]